MKYFVSYSYTDKNGFARFGNVDYTFTTKENLTIELIRSLEKDILKRMQHNVGSEVVVLNIIEIEPNK